MAKKSKKSEDILEIPELLRRLADNQVDDQGKKYKWVPAKFAEKYINIRPDGTKVYMYQEVEGSHRLYEDGRKVYSKDSLSTGIEHKWVMPQTKRTPKRRDIHSIIDRQIFKAMDTLKHAKKRLVIAAVRNALLEDEEIKEYLPKNVGVAISRRIAHLVSLQNIIYEKQTKSRTVLVRGRYKYV